jgi:hypothetical protein
LEDGKDAVRLRDILTHVLPFPPGEAPSREVERPSDLHDPALGEAVFHAILEGTVLQGAAPAATAVASLMAEAITGWAVVAPIPAPVRQPYAMRLLREAGADLVMVAELLGQRSLSATARHTRPRREMRHARGRWTGRN